MNSENKSSGPKPDARPPYKGRNSSKPQGANSSSAPVDRPPRRRDNNERREGGEQREGGDRRERPDRRDRPERQDRPDRQERGERPDRQRRPQTGQAAGAERSKPATEERAHRPVVYVKGDIATGSTWAKNGNGPSFADMVRQNAAAAAEKTSVKSTPPPAKQTPQQHQEQPQEQQQQQQPQQLEKPPAPQQQAPQQQAPQQQAQQQAPPLPAQQAPPAQPEESEEEEEVVVMTSVQAPAVVVMEAIPEPPAPAPPMIPPHYVLEIERVAAVNLPSRVTQTAEGQRGAYMFSAQAGKAPTPPPTVQPHALYRPDTANLGARQWSLGTDSRIQQPVQQPQQVWAGAGQMDYWNSAGERAPASRPFMGSQPQVPYNSYPTSMSLAHQRPASNAFAARLRTSDVPESMLRQQPSAPFNRPSQATNGGGVW